LGSNVQVRAAGGEPFEPYERTEPVNETF